MKETLYGKNLLGEAVGTEVIMDLWSLQDWASNASPFYTIMLEAKIISLFYCALVFGIS